MAREVHRVGRHTTYNTAYTKRERDGPTPAFRSEDGEFEDMPWGYGDPVNRPGIGYEPAFDSLWEQENAPDLIDQCVDEAISSQVDRKDRDLAIPLRDRDENPQTRPKRQRVTEPPARSRPSDQGTQRTRSKRKSAEPERPGRGGGAIALLQELLYLGIKILVIGVAFVLMFTFLFGILRYEDASMSPAVKDGDLVIYYRLDKQYTATDVVVLEYQDRPQIRRVIAIAGDVVDITEDGLFINGALQQETSIYEETLRYDTGVEFPLTVNEGEVFLLGDSRTNATDSRAYGAVEIEDTLGKVMTIIRRRGI